MSFVSVVLLTTTQEGAAVAARIRSFGVVRNPPPDGEYLFWKGYSYNLDFSGDVLSDIDPEEIEGVTAALGAPHATHVSCVSVEAAQVLLPLVLEGLSGFVYTDAGDVLEFQEFLDLMERHPAWDWRGTEVAELQDE